MDHYLKGIPQYIRPDIRKKGATDLNAEFVYFLYACLIANRLILFQFLLVVSDGR